MNYSLDLFRDLGAPDCKKKKERREPTLRINFGIHYGSAIGEVEMLNSQMRRPLYSNNYATVIILLSHSAKHASAKCITSAFDHFRHFPPKMNSLNENHTELIRLI